ncbi:hypothetical protein D046_5612B, partial [Vibrio parahaemolyticus V-223/04]
NNRKLWFKPRLMVKLLSTRRRLIVLILTQMMLLLSNKRFWKVPTRRQFLKQRPLVAMRLARQMLAM